MSNLIDSFRRRRLPWGQRRNDEKMDAMAERLRVKAELKKKATKPMGYAESVEAEKSKQKSLQKSKEERRIAMCEELGRGC